MTEAPPPSRKELERRLEEAESALEALRSGEVDSILGSDEELVVRLRRAEERERHINQVLMTIREVDQLMVKERDRRRLLERACQTLAEGMGYHSAWMALFSPSGELVMMSSSGLEDPGVMRERLEAGELPPTVERVLREEGLQVIGEPVTQCGGCPFSKEYAGRAAMAKRLSREGRVFGLACVSVPESFAADSREQELFSELADDLASALYRIEMNEWVLQLEDIISRIPQPISLITPDYRYAMVNNYYAVLYDRPLPEIVGRSMEELMGREDFERVRPHIDRCLDGDTVHFETVLGFPGLGDVWMAGRLFPYTGDTGEVVGVIFQGNDVSERKRAQEELRENRRRLQLLMDNLPGMAYRCSVSPDWSMEVVSAGSLELTGYSPDEMTGRGAIPFAELIHPDDRACVEETVSRAVERGERFELVYRIIHAGGEVRWVWEQGQAVVGEAGGPEALEGFIADITDRKRVEEALEASESEKELILNSTSELVSYLDRDLRVLWANRAAGESVGESPEELVGRHCYGIWADGDEPCSDCPVLEAAEAGEPVSLEKRTPDGRWWSIRGYPVIDADGEVTGLVEFGQDITARREAEEARERLEEQVERTQRLESIGRLAGGVAHDLNNLLTPILGYGEMLLEETLEGDPRRAPIEEVVRSSFRARDLVRQLLAFGRRQTMEFQRVDLGELLEDIESLLRRTIREDVEIEVAAAPDLPPVMGDPGQLEQVVMNLAVNARDAMPGGGRLSLSASLEMLDEGYVLSHEGVSVGPHVMLTVSDTGCGMERRVMQHIFEPFFTTKGKERGTGLGLATVYGIVKQHGGSINVYSEPGAGTTFRIYFPVAEGEAEERETGETEEADRGGSETVLLVEDEEQVRNLTRMILEQRGYSVLPAADGREALRVAEAHDGDIHLLLSDVVMPGMDCRELFGRLRELCPETRALYMSGYTDNVIAHHGIVDDGVEFLPKPFTIRALAAKVREVLDR